MKGNFKSTKFVISTLVMLWMLLVPTVVHACGYSSDVVLAAYGLLGTICVSFHIARTKEQKLDLEAAVVTKEEPKNG